MRKKTKGVLVSLTRYAKLVGISRQSVSRAVARGIITTTQDGRRKLVDPEVASRQRGEARLRDGFAEHDPLAAADFRQARAERLRLQAELLELKLAERRGDVVNRERAISAAEEGGRAIRRHLDSLVNYVEEIASAYESGGIEQARTLWQRRVAEVRAAVDRVLAR